MIAPIVRFLKTRYQKWKCILIKKRDTLFTCEEFFVCASNYSLIYRTLSQIILYCLQAAAYRGWIKITVFSSSLPEVVGKQFLLWQFVEVTRNWKGRNLLNVNKHDPLYSGETIDKISISNKYHARQSGRHNLWLVWRLFYLQTLCSGTNWMYLF